MIRIERNTHNLFSLLQFIAFVINTFTFSHLTDAYIQNYTEEGGEGIRTSKHAVSNR